ncbi:MAG: hypothetical protein NZ556_01225, partial [Fimbriimonadales bacterium]|nr:hypothetical protein [Fimbriimonadales bacterium]
MRTVIPLLGGLVLLALAGCGGDANSRPPQEVSVPVQVNTKTQQANLEFALNMLQQLDESANSNNLAFSPLSLSVALGMALNGAANETYDAIAKTLGYDQVRIASFNQQGRQLTRLLNSTDPAVVIHSANSLWVDEGFEVKPEYLRTLLTFY